MNFSDHSKKNIKIIFASVAIAVALSACAGTKQSNAYLLDHDNTGKTAQQRLSKIDQLRALPAGTSVEEISALVRMAGVDPKTVIRVSNKTGVVRDVRFGKVNLTGTPQQIEEDRKKWEGVDAWFIYAQKIDSKWSLGTSSFKNKSSGERCEVVFLVKDGKTISTPYFDIAKVNETTSKPVLPSMIEGVIKTAPGTGIGMAL